MFPCQSAGSASPAPAYPEAVTAAGVDTSTPVKEVAVTEAGGPATPLSVGGGRDGTSPQPSPVAGTAPADPPNDPAGGAATAGPGAPQGDPLSSAAAASAMTPSEGAADWKLRARDGPAYHVDAHQPMSAVFLLSGRAPRKGISATNRRLFTLMCCAVRNQPAGTAEAHGLGGCSDAGFRARCVWSGLGAGRARHQRR